MISILLSLQVAASVQQASPMLDATVVETSVVVASDAPGQTSSVGKGSRVRMTIQGKSIRYDNLEGTSAIVPTLSPHAYTIVQDGGLSFLTIDTVKKEFSRVDLRKVAEEMSDALSVLESLNMSVTDATSEVDSLGAGDTILGYRTNRWRSVQKFTMTASMGTDTVAMAVEMRTESLYAPVLDSILAAADWQANDSLTSVAPFANMLPKELVEKMNAAQEKLPKGMPIKATATQAVMMGPIDMTTTSTTQITKIEKVKQPVSFFVVPPGYKEVESQFPLPEKPAQ